MKTRHIFKAAALTVLFSAGAVAQANPVGEGDTLMNEQVHGQSGRTFAQARAESLASKAKGISISSEGYGEDVHAPGNQKIGRAAVRADAIQALRVGAIGQGDASNS